MKFQIVPLPDKFLAQVRQDDLDDLQQPVRRLISKEGGEPCRDVLRRAKAGEELILASFSPFEQTGPYKEYGPIFVLAKPSQETPKLDCLPTTNSSNFESYFSEQFVLRAYDSNENMVEAVIVKSAEAESTLEKLLSLPEANFVHARFPAAGCFGCRIERA